MKRLLSLVLVICLLGTTTVFGQVTYQRITNLANVVRLTPPAVAGRVYIPSWVRVQAEGANVRWRSDGSSPSATTGNQICAGDVEIIIAENFNNIILAQESAGAIVNIQWGRGPAPRAVGKSGQDTDAVRLVVAADWQGNVRGGQHVTHCDGTAGIGGDQIELQAAIDAAEADGPATGGGIVEIRGTLYLSPRVGETAWNGLGNVSATNTLTIDSFATGSIADVELGQLVRIYDNNATPSSSAHYDDHVATVIAKGANTITFSPATDTTYPVAEDVKFRRVVPCVVLPPGVSLRGVAPEASRLRMVADPPAGEYAMVATEDTGSGPGGHGYNLQHLDLWGNKAVNANLAVTHGAVFNRYALETSLMDVGIWNLSGSGLVHNYCHGFRYTGCSWVEGCDEHGGVFSAGHAMIIGPKFTGNARANVLFKGAYQSTFMGRCGAGVNDSEGVVIIRSTGTAITGSTLAMTGDNVKAIRIGYASYENTITGNNFLFQTGTGMTWLDMDSWGNVVSNNTLNIAAATTITTVDAATGKGEANNIVDNVNVEDRFNYRYCRLTNNTGGVIPKWRLVVRPGVSGDQDEMGMTTTVGDKFTVGLTVVENTADGSAGYVQKSGWTTAFPAQKDKTFAVGELVGTGAKAGPEGSGVVIGTAGNGEGAGYAIGVCYEPQTAGAAGDPLYLDVLLFDKPIYVP